MLIEISQLNNRPVVAFDEAEPLGVLRDPIIDSNNGKVAGYFCGHGFLHMRQDVLGSDDIAAYDQSRVIINGKNSLTSLEESSAKIKEILEKKIPVFGAMVLTESGKHLGWANDLLLDTELNMIVKYYVQGVMQQRVIAADQVIVIDKRGIIVNDLAMAGSGLAATNV